jgi:HSP20 family protein
VTPIYPDLSDFAIEIRRAFEELDRHMGSRSAGEYVPPIDVFDAPDGLTIVADLPGVPSNSVRALIKNGVVIIIGEKPCVPCGTEGAQFHIAERSFGRFARGVRLHGSFDGASARASLKSGELRIVIPRLDERRGTEIAIPIDTTS